MEHRPNPKLSANAFSRLFFCWLFPIFIQGRKHELESEDLYEVLPENLSEPVTDRLENFWRIELTDASNKKRKPSLFKAIRRTFQGRFLKFAVHFFFSHFIFKALQPLTLGLLIWNFDERSNSSSLEAYGYATAFVSVTVLDQMLFGHMLFGMRSIGISARVACASLIYRKIMKLPHSSKQVTGGRIINLLSNDVAKLEFSFLFIHTLWILPLQVIVITYLIWRNVGVASVVGVTVLLIQTIPVQAFSGRVIAQLRRKIAAKTDERVLLTGEIVHGIRVIKMYTWEKPFEQLVFLARRCEMDVIATTAYLKSVLLAIMSFAQRTPLFTAIMIYVLQGNNITAYIMFSLVQYFNILHVMTGSYFLRSVNTLSEGIASIRRIQEFLLLEEQSSDIKTLQSNNEDSIVKIEGVSASSVENKDVNFLHGINLHIRQNLLYAVVGSVGAGKSSLLKLILDELKPSKGQVYVYGRISYCSQEPWLFRDSVKRNILFADVYEENRYERVKNACALSEDFEQLPKGDETIVGESITTLSAGQCARINLARTVYRDADIYLLDDPLSAVDTQVGKRLFDDCINGMLRDKTRILVTHQIQYLKEADQIIIIDKGRVVFQGNYANFEKVQESNQYLNLNDVNESDLSDTIESIKNSILSSKSHSNDVDEDTDKDHEETEKLINSEKIEQKPNEKEESKNVRQVILKGKLMYWKYFTAAGCCLPFSTLLAFISAQTFCSGSDYFVAYWTRKQDIRYNSTNSAHFEDSILPQNIDSHTAIYVFGILMVGSIIMSVTKMVLFSTVCRNTNEKIHNKMASSVLRTKMQFFETNDYGQILNRFSKDLGTVDERLQAMMLEASEYIFIVLGVVIQIVVINQWSILAILALVAIFLRGRVIAIKTTRSIMRLEGQAKSPVFTHVNSSFAGIMTIRSCKAQAMVCRQFDVHQDNHTAAASVSQYALIAYSFWLDLITVTFTTLLTYAFVAYRNSGVAGADVGLAITQVLILCGVLSRGIKLTADIEMQMISVERLFQYTTLEREDAMEDNVVQKPVASWPSRGKIVFSNVSMRYHQDNITVLKDLQFTIEAGAKIGIVGRTGAGKSSLTAALFRLAKTEGTIYIDDLDTKTIEIKHLRSKISILPQEPILFSVSLRKNLDPLEEFNDASLWSALQDVELNKVFLSLDTTLNQNDLSTGQRQLLCLARAVLKRNKILVLDEATANVDSNTEALIQRTIRAKFKDCTVLMIAHRLNTIMDCDKVMVLDQGRIVEYDEPRLLLQKNNGYFTRMASQIIALTSEQISDEVSKIN